MGLHVEFDGEIGADEHDDEGEDGPEFKEDFEAGFVVAVSHRGNCIHIVSAYTPYTLPSYTPLIWGGSRISFLLPKR